MRHSCRLVARPLASHVRNRASPLAASLTQPPWLRSLAIPAWSHWGPGASQRRLLSSRAGPQDPYTVLGVSRGASQRDIKRSYFALAKKWHPDLNPGDSTAEARFKEISAAYAILGDEAKRRAYDLGGNTGYRQYQQRENKRQRREAPGAQGQSTGADEDDPYEMFRAVFKEFGLDEFSKQAQVMQNDLEVAMSALMRGDYAPSFDFMNRYRVVVVGVLLPIAILFRFPGLVIAAMRGLVLGGLFLLRVPAIRNLVLRWLWRVMVSRSRRK